MDSGISQGIPPRAMIIALQNNPSGFNTQGDSTNPYKITESLQEKLLVGLGSYNKELILETLIRGRPEVIIAKFNKYKGDNPYINLELVNMKGENVNKKVSDLTIVKGLTNVGDLTRTVPTSGDTADKKQPYLLVENNSGDIFLLDSTKISAAVGGGVTVKKKKQNVGNPASPNEKHERNYKLYA